MQPRRRTAALGAVLLSVVLVLLTATAIPAQIQVAHAASFTVNSTGDGGDNNPGDGTCDDGSGDCTLRAAVEELNALADPTNTINFNLPDDSTINLGSELDINVSVEINGPGADDLTLDAGNSSRHILFNPTSENLTVQDLTLVNGNNGTAGGAIGVDSDGIITIDDVVFRNNNGGSAGGALYLDNQTTGSGEVTITDSVFDNNTAGDGGAIIILSDGSRVVIRRSTFTNNDADPGYGGAINMNDNNILVVEDFEFTGNTAVENGGAIHLFDDNDPETSEVDITDGVFVENEAINGAAINARQVKDGVSVSDITFVRNDATVNGGAMLIVSSTNIVNSTFYDNNTQVNDGGALDIDNGINSLNNVTIFGNSAGDEAGGISFDGGTTTLSNTLVAGNADAAGVPDCNDDNGTIVDGGYNLIGNSGNNDADDCAATISNGVNGNIVGAPAGTVEPDLNQTTFNTVAFFVPSDDSPALNAGDNTTCEDDSQRGTDRPKGGDCDIGAAEYAPGGGGDDDDDDDDDGGGGDAVAAAPQAPTNPQQGFCNVIGGANRGFLGQDSGNDAFCRVINEDGTYLTNPAEIGDMSVINRGVLQAVDVFSFDNNGNPKVPFGGQVRICLQGQGQVLFLNAAADRAVQGLGAVSDGGYTCATLPNAGTIVLVNGQPAPAANPVSTEGDNAAAGAGGAATTTSASVPLTDCTATTTFAVRGRSTPRTATDNNVVTTLPFDLTLEATERVPGWLRLIYQDGQVWVSDEYLSTAGNCGN